MRPWVSIVVMAVLACDPNPEPAAAKPKAPAAKLKPKKNDMQPLTVDWKLERKGNALHLSYTVQNVSDKPVVLLDRLYQTSSKGNEPAFDRVIVRSGGSADEVLLVRGYVAPEPSGGVGGVLPPLSRKLEPKQKITGEATIPLPLTAWHNFARPRALTGTPKQAVLEIGYLVDHAKWIQVTLSDGTTASAPGHPFVTEQKLLRGAAKPIP